MKITPGKLAKDYRRAYHLRDFVKAEINLGENLVYNIKIRKLFLIHIIFDLL